MISVLVSTPGIYSILFSLQKWATSLLKPGETTNLILGIGKFSNWFVFRTVPMPRLILVLICDIVYSLD